MITDKKCVDDVIAYLQDMIVSGELKPGGRYPSERLLAQQFGLSRNTVREAIQYFSMIGVASIRQGSGTYLINDGAALKKFVESRQKLKVYNWTEIQQTRRIIEMGVVKLAAENANQEDKLRLRNALKVVEDREKHVSTDIGVDTYLKADYDLHEAIALTTRNTILIELHASLREESLAMAEIWKRFANLVDVVNPTHDKIIAAIMRNDVDAAATAMDEHLCYMEYRIKLNRTIG